MVKNKVIHKYKSISGSRSIGGCSSDYEEVMKVEELDYIEPILTEKEKQERNKFNEMVDVLYYFQEMFPKFKIDTVIATSQFKGYFVEIKKGSKKETVNFHIDKDLILDTTNTKFPNILEEDNIITFKEWKDGRGE